MRIISLLKILVVVAIGAVWFFGGSGPRTAAPLKSSSIESWLGPQNWQKHRAGPVRVIAPAGSGKTRTLGARLLHLVDDRGIEPQFVTAVAYNNRAAREMRERL